MQLLKQLNYNKSNGLAWSVFLSTMRCVIIVVKMLWTRNIKDNKRNICSDLLTIEKSDLHTLHYANVLLVRVRLDFQKQIDISLLCACPLVEGKFPHNIVKVCYGTNCLWLMVLTLTML